MDLPGPVPEPVPAGATFGVEEEFHLVDPGTFELTRAPSCAPPRCAGRSARGSTPRSITTQLETVTRHLRRR